MHKFIIVLGMIMLAIFCMGVSSNLSIQARSLEYLKEDTEVAVHDAALQLDRDRLSYGEIVIDYDQALATFKESFELNSRLEPSEYTIIDFQVFDDSNSNFSTAPVTYNLASHNFSDVFSHPTVVAVIETNTSKYFFTSDEKTITRLASYTYKN